MTASLPDSRAQLVPPPGGMLPPADAEVAVWWTTIDLPVATLSALRADLDTDTLARVNALVRDDDRRRAVAAHGLLRRLLAACTGLQPGEIRIERRCRTCGATDHGKPSLASTTGTARTPVQFNLAHSGDHVAVAIAGPLTDVGVDVEGITPGFDWTPTRKHVFTDAEWAQTGHSPDPTARRFELWARKEAAVKATGHGLSVDLRHVGFEPPPLGESSWRARVTAPEGAYALAVTDLDFPPGIAGAVATMSRRPAGAAPPAVAFVRADFSTR